MIQLTIILILDNDIFILDNDIDTIDNDDIDTIEKK